MKLIGLVGLLAASTALAETRLEISVVSDWETVQYYGSVDETRKVINSMADYAKGIYRDQLGIDLVVTYVQIPLNASEDRVATHRQPVVLLDTMKQYRVNDQKLLNTDVTVLATVRQMFIGNKNYAGYATQSNICSSSTVAMVSMRNNGLDGQTLAHEIGHNLGAPHDGDSPCEKELNGSYLMSSSWYGGDFFSSCSVEVIKKEIALYGDCLIVKPVIPIQATSSSTTQSGGGSFNILFALFLGIFPFMRKK